MGGFAVVLSWLATGARRGGALVSVYAMVALRCMCSGCSGLIASILLLSSWDVLLVFFCQSPHCWGRDGAKLLGLRLAHGIRHLLYTVKLCSLP